MSEIEINEDNCVLDDADLFSIGRALEYYLSIFEIGKNRKRMKKIFNEIILKITKLNNLAKEKKQ